MWWVSNCLIFFSIFYLTKKYLKTANSNWSTSPHPPVSTLSLNIWRRGGDSREKVTVFGLQDLGAAAAVRWETFFLKIYATQLQPTWLGSKKPVAIARRVPRNLLCDMLNRDRREVRVLIYALKIESGFRKRVDVVECESDPRLRKTHVWAGRSRFL